MCGYDAFMLQVEEWIGGTGTSVAGVARRAGLARSTLLRIAKGLTNPTVGTLREIAIACGLDLSITAVPLSDPAAAEAARLMLEDGYVASDPANASQWIDRLRRNAGDDPVSIVQAAGTASTLRHRLGAVHLMGEVPVLRVASAGDAANGRWAISGAPPMGAEGVVVLWSERPDDAAAHLRDVAQPSSGARATLIVAPAHPGIFIDAWSEDSVTYVAPIQMLLDNLGLGGPEGDIARTIAESW